MDEGKGGIHDIMIARESYNGRMIGIFHLMLENGSGGRFFTLPR